MGLPPPAGVMRTMNPLLCLLLWDLLDLVLGECHPPKNNPPGPFKCAVDLGFAPPTWGSLWGGGVQAPSLDLIMGDWFWSHLVMEQPVWTRQWGTPPHPELRTGLKPINGVLVLEPLIGERLIVDLLIGRLFWTW